MSNPPDAIKIWALGRPFAIGTLYNYVDDTIIPKIRLWEPDSVSRVLDVNTYVKSTAKVHTKKPEKIDDDQNFDGEEEQTSFLSQLGMDDHTAVSLAAGILRPPLKGAWQYASDWVDSKAQLFSAGGQVTIHCRCSSKKVSVDPEKQLEIVCRLEKLVTCRATHVVVAITYGLEAFCIFPQDQANNQGNETNDEEIIMEITRNYACLFNERLINENEHLEPDRDEEGDSEDGHCRPIPEEYHCIVYSDLMMAKDEKYWTLKPVAEQYEACRKVLANGGKAIPLRVWLYPLHKLVLDKDGRIPINVPDVSRNLLHRCDHLFSRFQRIRAQVEMLIQKTSISHQCIPLTTSKRIHDFHESLSKLIPILIKALGLLTISIRRGTAQEETMDGMIQAVDTQSPFDIKKLNRWLSHQKMQIETLERLAQLPGVLFTTSMERLKDELKIRANGSYAVIRYLPSMTTEESNDLVDQMDRCIDKFSQTTSISSMNWTTETGTKTMQMTSYNHRQIYDSGQKLSNWVMDNNCDNDSIRYIICYDECNADNTRPIPPFTRLYQYGTGVTKDYTIPEAPGQVMVIYNHRGVIMLGWTSGNMTDLSNYLFQYRSVDGQEEHWKSIRHRSTTIEMNYLQSGETYLFRVAAVTLGGRSPFSPVSQEVTIDPVSPAPTGLQADEVTDTSIAISWHHRPYFVNDSGDNNENEEENDYYENDFYENEMEISIINYSVECWRGDGHRESTFIQRNTKEKRIVLEPLVPDTAYHIQVRVVCADSSGSTFYSQASTILIAKTLRDAERAAHIVRRSSQKSAVSHGIDVYELPLKNCNTQMEGVGHYVFGEPSCLALAGKRRQRTILVLGATGSGKSTLINAMVNYVLGIEWEDDFRFKLINEPADKSQAHSQTDLVTTYDLYEMKGFRLGYSLTVVDTPGFGDTSGIEKDKKIMQQIQDYFKCRHGIQQLEAVCFVVQASLARLTETQQYIFDSILSIFGEDIKDNIRLMVTFADGDVPPVLEAVKEAGVPSAVDPTSGQPLHHKFNNSIFFANNKGDRETNETNQNYFEMAVTGFDGFFDDLSRMEVKSLRLTRDVLEKRKRLQALVEGLQQRIEIKLARIDEFEEIKKVLAENQQQMEDNKNFDFEVEFLVPKETDISGTGQYTTNCQTCHTTCHFPCTQANDSEKHRCSMMDRTGNCTICKCPWNNHFNQKYRYELVKEKVQRSSDAIRLLYQGAKTKALTNEELLASIQKEIGQHDKQLLKLVQETFHCIQQLNEIALKPHTFSTLAYVDLMIATENQRLRSGYQHRITTLKRLRKVAELTDELVSDHQNSPTQQSQPQTEGIVNRRRSSLLFKILNSSPKLEKN